MLKKIISTEELCKIVDFDKLKKCNAICMKWSKRFNIKRKEHVYFMINLMKDIESYTSKLPVKFRSQFVKDCKIMFYAAEIEHVLLKQFHPMVLSVMRKMHLKIDEFDHYETDGLMAIRMAAWGYLYHKTNASFVTYIYNSIFGKIRACRYKQYQKRIRRTKKLKIYNFSEHKKCTTIQTTTQPEKQEYCDVDTEIKKIAEICELTTREAHMLQCFANRENENAFWVENFIKQYDEKVDKLQIRNELRRLQTKVFLRLKKTGMIPSEYMLPRMRSKQVL